MRTPTGPIHARRGRFALLVMVGLLTVNSSTIGQDGLKLSSQAKTTSNSEIPVDHLQVTLRPLTKDELEAELRSWLDVLRAKITEVGGTELQLKALTEGESDDTLTEQLVALRTAETALVERTRIVLGALKAKGGDVEIAEQYVNAVSDISETTDSTSYRAAIVAEVSNWVARDDGGKLWVKRFVVALIILLFFWMISKVAGRIVAKALARHPRASTLLENFARRTTGGAVFVIGLMMALGTLGVPLGPLMAALGGGGFIVGFALQETLGNFASGMLIMVYPLVLGDLVDDALCSGHRLDHSANRALHHMDLRWSCPLVQPGEDQGGRELVPAGTKQLPIADAEHLICCHLRALRGAILLGAVKTHPVHTPMTARRPVSTIRELRGTIS